MADAAPTLTLFELRRYRARPGLRDALVAMFEAHFRPAYEAAGATILASFTVHDDPDAWVWIRAFPSAAARKDTLAAFYGGAVWRQRGADCNATLAEVSSARVLRAVDAGALAHAPPRAALPDLARPWVASVAPRAAGTRPGADGLSPPPLLLASSRSVVWLRRFDTLQAALAWQVAALQRAGTPQPAQWLLLPTPCSRLR